MSERRWLAWASEQNQKLFDTLAEAKEAAEAECRRNGNPVYIFGFVTACRPASVPVEWDSLNGVVAE